MKNKLPINALIFGFILLLSVATCYFFINVFPNLHEQIIEEVRKQSEARKKLYGENQAADTEFTTNMSELEVQEAIHYMSHQKVKADRKWGALPLTKSNVEGLINAVEANDYLHKDVYLDILYSWYESDFSEVDKAHNTVWKLLGGTVGQAYGVLSAEEEEAYIKQHFE